MATYRTGIETKQKILKASRKLFYKNGISKTTFARIAETANVDISSIVYHFKSFNNLLLTLRNEMTLERRDLVRKKIAEKYPDETFTEMMLYSVEFRIAIDLYIKYKPYYNFLKDVYFLIQHLSTEASVTNLYANELNTGMSKNEIIMYECLFKPFQYMIPEFVHIKKVEISGKEIADFFSRVQFKAYNQDEDYVQQHIDKRNEIADNITIKCSKNFTLS